MWCTGRAGPVYVGMTWGSARNGEDGGGAGAGWGGVEGGKGELAEEFGAGPKSISSPDLAGERRRPEHGRAG